MSADLRHFSAEVASATAGLRLLDMPDGILQHISRSISGNEWALGAGLACRALDRLPLPVMKVRYYDCPKSQHRLPELFTWVGKRIKATTHLSIHIDNVEWDSQSPGCAIPDMMTHFFSSGHKLNANMETLEVRTSDTGLMSPNGALMSWLQDHATRKCPRLATLNMSLDKAPSWGVTGPSLRHIHFFFPSRPTAEGLFANTSGFDSQNLPHLETLCLQGSPKPLELEGIYFQDSGRLEAVHICECWIHELSLPTSCKLTVSAQSSSFVLRMDESRDHPLLTRANHVGLPTDLNDRVISEWDSSSNDSDEDAQGPSSRSAMGMGILDMFPAMRSLYLGWPHVAFRGSSHFWGGDDDDDCRCFVEDLEKMDQQYYDMPLVHMKCLFPQWQNGNLRELSIEGKSLGMTIPVLPCLKTLLVSCTDNVAVDFTDAALLGGSITKMSISGKNIRLDTQQHHELCKALKTRDLELGGDISKFISVHARGHPVPAAAEVYKCPCKACYLCLGIGTEVLERDDPAKGAWSTKFLPEEFKTDEPSHELLKKLKLEP